MDAFVSFVWNYVAFLGSCFIIICFIALIYLIFFDIPATSKKSSSGGGGGGGDDYVPKLPPDRPPGQKLLTQKNNSPSFTRAVIKDKVR